MKKGKVSGVKQLAFSSPFRSTFRVDLDLKRIELFVYGSRFHQARSCRGHGGQCPPNEKYDMNLPPPHRIIDHRILLGTYYLYKILAPPSEGKGRYCPPRLMCPATWLGSNRLLNVYLTTNRILKSISDYVI